jgi:hypothetical protein
MPTTPTNQIQIDFLIDLISQGKSHGECLALFGTKWNKSKNTFERRLKIANRQHKEARLELDKKLNELTTNKAIKALESGLKLKIEHQMELQKEIEELQKMLDAGFIAKKIKIDGIFNEKIEVFGIYEITQVQRLIDEKRKELFKLDGMYAPLKNSNTTTEGKDIITTPTLIIQPVQSLSMIPNEPE